MDDWDDFKAEPKVSLRDEIKPMRSNIPVGRLGVPYNRECTMVFVKKVTRGNPPENPDDYFNKAEGYTMSEDVVDQLDLHCVEIVFIYEEDTGLVLEHELDDLKKQNGRYPISEYDVEYRWEGLGEDFFTNKSFWSQQ